MLKSRLIFTLLYDNGNFSVSRNFNLQSVGDLSWLRENYEFESIARSVDELVILNVSRSETDRNAFYTCIEELSSFSFMPIAVGGKVRSLEDADRLFKSGADKLVLNTPYFINPDFVKQLVRLYGMQALLGSLDFKKNGSNYDVYANNGLDILDMDLLQAIRYVEDIGVGELYLTSIDRDGTGQGYELDALKLASQASSVPIIASGGADTFDKLTEGITSGYTNAVATSHLFNFMGDGLFDARISMLGEGVKLSIWEFKNEIYG
uniref:HisA/HisF-related TIM barrel protein n=1 Tax=Algoriphagus sp. TaxID=1872435 RepID=UPI004047C5A8